MYSDRLLFVLRECSKTTLLANLKRRHALYPHIRASVAWKHVTLMLVVLCVLVVGISQALAATVQEPACELSQQRQITDALLDHRFTDAKSLLATAKDLSVAEKMFYTATIDLAIADTKRSNSRQTLTRSAFEQLKKTISALQSQATSSDTETLILGMSEAFLARMYLEQKAWFKAYRMGYKSRARLQALLKTNPDATDAYLVLGMFEYYTGSVPKGLKWLTYLVDFSGDRKQGLRWLERAIADAPTAAPEAARVLLDELALKSPEICQWIPLNESMSDAYPNNPVFAWKLQKHYRLCGYPAKALQASIKANQRLGTLPSYKHRFLRERAFIYRDLGDVDAVRELQRRSSRLRKDATLIAHTEAVKHKNTEVYQAPVKIQNLQSPRFHSGCQTPETASLEQRF